MEDLAEQFKAALGRIEIRDKKRERAVKAHEEVRGVLESSEVLRADGVATALIGSYARRTGIYPGKDVDILVKLTKLDTTADPQAVYDKVRDVLVDEYGGRAEEQSRSIKIAFPDDGDEDGFSVDAVPAVRMGKRWGIPRHDRSHWTASDVAERWTETDPEELARLTETLNGKLKVDGQGAYVPTVKLVRQTRRHHMRDRKPGGLYFELLTYTAFTSGAVTGDCFAEIFAGTLSAIAARLASGEVVMDPVLGRPYRPTPKSADLSRAAQTFSALAAKAQAALQADRCEAAVRWREILGENARGMVFEIPPGCDEQGRPLKRIAAVAAVGSEEAGSFARPDA